ncbi:MAG: transposase, partial [Verrucomicrobiales bacterium]|nr:transposase [Verrucomicrobiales bacterium]
HQSAKSGYDLWSDVIMPNHVHALFTLRDGESLPDTLQGWKGVLSRLIHQTGLSALNPLWPDDFDRLIRSPEHFSTVKADLAANPSPWDEATEACYHGKFSDKLDEFLDAAHGSRSLRDPRLARHYALTVVRFPAFTLASFGIVFCVAGLRCVANRCDVGLGSLIFSHDDSNP